MPLTRVPVEHASVRRSVHLSVRTETLRMEEHGDCYEHLWQDIAETLKADGFNLLEGTLNSPAPVALPLWDHGPTGAHSDMVDVGAAPPGFGWQTPQTADPTSVIQAQPSGRTGASSQGQCVTVPKRIINMNMQPVIVLKRLVLLPRHFAARPINTLKSRKRTRQDQQQCVTNNKRLRPRGCSSL